MSTSDRLTPLGPMPRSDTPCVVGCACRLLVRRNRLKVGTRRRTSSAPVAGDWRICSLSTTVTLAGTSPSRCSVRVGVTVTDSKSPAGASTISSGPFGVSGWLRSAKPPARTTSVVWPAVPGSRLKRPSGPVTVWACTPELPITSTVAPETTAPDSSRTTPDTARLGEGGHGGGQEQDERNCSDA